MNLFVSIFPRGQVKDSSASAHPVAAILRMHANEVFFSYIFPWHSPLKYLNFILSLSE